VLLPFKAPVDAELVEPENWGVLLVDGRAMLPIAAGVKIIAAKAAEEMVIN